MIKTATGKIMSGIGGIYCVKLNDSDKLVNCRARGIFRHENTVPVVGDNVVIEYNSNNTEHRAVSNKADSGAVINEILPRKNLMPRPPLANLDLLFIVIACAYPEPVTETVDKLISFAEYFEIEPVIVIGKKDIDAERARELAGIYSAFKVFVLSATDESESNGVSELMDYIESLPSGTVSAFTGASGVGKSTLINRLFPSLRLETGTLSAKNERGRHTTRKINLYPVGNGTYIADTPGFSMLEIEAIPDIKKEDLKYTFREFEKYLGSCRYASCTHTKEEDCAVVQAVINGELAKSRHTSYVEMYTALKNRHSWDTKSK